MFVGLVSGFNVASNNSDQTYFALDDKAGGAGTSQVGQTFVVLQGGSISSVTLWLKLVANTDIVVVVTIEGVVDPLVDETTNETVYLTSGSLNMVAGGSDTWFDAQMFNFTDHFEFPVGQGFCWVLKVLSGNIGTGHELYVRGSLADAYAGGNAFNYYSSAYHKINADARFGVEGEEYVAPTPTPSPVPTASPVASAIGGSSSGGFVVYFVILVLFAVVAVVAGLWLTAGDDSMNKGVALLFAFVAFVVFMVLFFGSGWFG